MPLISLDAALMERALSNLLDNALRFTPAAGRISIKIEPAPDRVRIAVADTGPGVPAEDQPKVFDRFFQGSRHREQRGSSGLGLAIVRRIAQLHGGEAGLESIHGQGANFWVELPTRSPLAAGAPMPRG
jgi:signal transduction histidine kinase